jgi:hypothetical protein
VSAPVGVELLLHPLKDIGVDDGRVHSVMELTAVANHPEIDPVAQHVEERAAIERVTADRLAVGPSPHFSPEVGASGS